MKRNKTKLTAALAACALAVTAFAACTGAKPDPYAIAEMPADFTYFPVYQMNAAKSLKVFGRTESLNTDQVFLAEAVQGLFARTEITYFYGGDQMAKHWLAELRSDYGVQSSDVTLASMLADYKTKFGDNAGYVRYDTAANADAVNIATNICSATGWLPVAASLEAAVQAAGLTKKEDVGTMTQKACFEAYRDRLDNSALVQQRANLNHLRDYAIANRYFTFYEERTTTPAIQFRSSVHQWAQDNVPIYGWGPGTEDSHVGFASVNGQFTLASDYCYNMTAYSSKDFVEKFEQPNTFPTIQAEQGKHYVCVTMSDGDNLQTWFNTFATSDKYMGAQRADFPMGWSINPSLADTAPNILKSVYQNADKNDFFVCAVSGQGYMYPKTFSHLKEFLGGLDVYLSRADLNAVQILDSGYDRDVVEYYSRVKSLKGGMYMYGDKYSGGKGSVYWSSNGKPFVTFRETLWNTTGEDVASRINAYPTEPTDISGYTLVNLHPWSCDYSDVVAMVNAFDPNVVMVTSDQFFDLITANVPHTDKVLS